MSNHLQSNDKSSKIDTAQLIIDFIHRTVMHHAMWFAQVYEHLGKEKAFEALKTVYETGLNLHLQRIAKTLDFQLVDGLPDPIMNLSQEKMISLRDSLAVNWLANDGIWFQAVEFTSGMEKAKLCNDTCWEKFSPLEAWSIKRLLKLPERAGLEGLKTALQYRMYAFINKQTIVEETSESFVFRMNECRVQHARKRKGLDDYPCKSAGIVEYSTFAREIDDRIKTECIACPPDEHPEEWYCAWRFYL